MHDDVFGFDVSVNDSFSMNVIEPDRDLPNDICSVCVLEPVLLLEHGEEVAIHAELLKQIDALSVAEESV